eukprot:Colp12_sorted_trinity150504_noHs@14065
MVELPVSDNEYPPLRKTFTAYTYVAEHLLESFGFAMHLDSDTYMRPQEIASILAEHSVEENLYLGRPLYSCACVPGRPTGLNCTTKDLGTPFCSGAGYVFSRKTLNEVRPKWDWCMENVVHMPCNSSDLLMGWCLKQTVGVTCSPAVKAAVKQAPFFGITWGSPNPVTHIQPDTPTLMCQDRSHEGGINERNNVGRSYNFDKVSLSLCAYFHPAKFPEHFRYFEYAHSRVVAKGILGSEKTAVWP